MKVIRCPSCSARYNADRLPPGAVFDCTRCGHAVTVRSHPTPLFSLALAGLLVLGAVFLWSTETLTPNVVLPWEMVQHPASLTATASLGLWAILGLWTLVTAFLPGFKSRGALTLGLGALALVLASFLNGSGYPITDGRALPWMLGIVLLTAGLVLVARSVRGRGVTGLLLAGSLLVLAVYTVSFGEGDVTPLQGVIRDVRALFDGTLGDDRGTFSYLAGDVGLHVALLLAALGGLLAALGVRTSAFAVALLLFVAYVMLVPGAIRIGEIFQDDFTWASFGQEGLRTLASALVQDGVALWVLLAWATADLVAAQEVTS